MTEVHTMRDLEYLEEQNRQLRESLKACKLDVNKLRAAVEEIYKDSHQVHILEIARAALEGK